MDLLAPSRGVPLRVTIASFPRVEGRSTGQMSWPLEVTSDYPFHRLRSRKTRRRPGSRVPALCCRCPRCPLSIRLGLLKGLGFSPRWRAAGHARFGLGFGFLLGYRAA